MKRLGDNSNTYMEKTKLMVTGKEPKDRDKLGR